MGFRKNMKKFTKLHFASFAKKKKNKQTTATASKRNKRQIKIPKNSLNPSPIPLYPKYVMYALAYLVNTPTHNETPNIISHNTIYWIYQFQSILLCSSQSPIALSRITFYQNIFPSLNNAHTHIPRTFWELRCFVCERATRRPHPHLPPLVPFLQAPIQINLIRSAPPWYAALPFHQHT